MEINFIFQIIILIVSIMAHEVSHGAAAYYFGDSTAKNQGRLTLNPLKHIDLFGSIILPLVLFVTQTGFIFGWAKPVPYNPYNLHPRRLGEFCVAIAGIITNFLLAIIFAIVIRLAVAWGFSDEVLRLMAYIVLLNITLGVFNLVPIPPLDGSKILFTLVPYRYERELLVLERYGFFLVVVFLVFFGQYLGVVVSWLFRLLI